MANLLGQNIGTNYKGILSLDSTINTPLDATLRAVTDGEGNASPLQLSTDAVSLGGATGARLGIKGSGTDATTTALLVENSAGTELFKVVDGGSQKVVRIGSALIGTLSYFGTIVESTSTQTFKANGIAINGDYTAPAASTRLHIKGSSTTASTTALLVQNSAGTELLKVTDDGITSFGTNSNINAISNKLSIYNIASSFLKVDQQTGFGTNFTATERVKIQGMGSTFATTALLVQNSAGVDLLKVLDSGSCVVNGTLSSGTLTSQRFFANSAFPFSLPFVYDAGSTSSANTSGVRDAYKGSFTYLPTSGTGELNIFNASPTINQTGGANGITRGLFINPTLTAAADFRAIETTNGKVVFGNLPTSAAGLPSGAIWNNSGVINIV